MKDQAEWVRDGGRDDSRLLAQASNRKNGVCVY